MTDAFEGYDLTECAAALENAAEYFNECIDGLKSLFEIFDEIAERMKSFFDFAEEITEYKFEKEKPEETVFILPFSPPRRPASHKAIRWRAAVFGHYITPGEGKPGKEGGEQFERRISRKKKTA